jgi:hypothetical protein
MRRPRWEAILRYIHLVDNIVLEIDRQSPAYDKIVKVRWLLDEFRRLS